MKAPLPYVWLVEQFAAVGESFPEDVTAVHVFLTEDVHFGDVGMELELYGRAICPDVPDAPDVRGAPVVAERVDYLDDMLDTAGILAGDGLSATIIRRLFDEKAWNCLCSRSVQVLWNPGCLDPPPVIVDLQNLENCQLLRSMAQ